MKIAEKNPPDKERVFILTDIIFIEIKQRHFADNVLPVF